MSFSTAFCMIFSAWNTYGLVQNANEEGNGKYRSSKKILWDIHHINDNPIIHPDSINTIFRSIAEDLDLTLVVNDRGVMLNDMNEFVGLVVSVGTSQESPYTPDEVSVIRDFVNEGGGLFIMGDGNSHKPENINPVAESFGTTTGLDEILPDNLIITDLSNHPVFEGVDTVFYENAGRLETVPPSFPIAWEDAGRIVVAVSEYGNGRVVITGDAGAFGDSPGPGVIGIEGNMTFTRNILRWIIQLDCSDFDDLEETISQAGIHNHGVLRSLMAKANNAEMQFDLGNLHTSGNILCALLHEVDGQEGNHIEPSSAVEIRECLRSMAETRGISLPCSERKKEVALRFEAYPNPYSILKGDVLKIIGSSLPYASNTTLDIYDVSGRLVRNLIDEDSPVTSSTVPFTFSWDGKNNFGRQAQVGIYYLRLTAGESNISRKIILLK